MAFTYLGTLATDRDKARFYLQDTVENSGPKPSGGNFTDAELDGLITVEGSWQRAVAAGFEALAAIWRTRYDFASEGQSFRRSGVAEGFAKDAAKWRLDFGGTAQTSDSAVTRIDAYSDDIDSDE